MKNEGILLPGTKLKIINAVEGFEVFSPKENTLMSATRISAKIVSE